MPTRVVRKSGPLSRGRKGLLVIFLCLGGFLIPYIGFFLYAMEDFNSVSTKLEAPDTASFIQANASRLYAMAIWYEQNIARYHMPHNMVMNTIFNSTKDPATGQAIPIGYHVDYDSAEWTGHYLLAEATRYVVHTREKRIDLAQWTLNNISRTLDGIDKILHVAPNGGMARYAWPIEDYQGDLENLRENHYRGTWNGSEYIFVDDTSRDMHNGVIMGLGAVYYFVDEPTIRARVKGLVEDMLDQLIGIGGMYLNPSGETTGMELDAGFWVFGTAGIWTLAYLKVGELVNPEKYGPLYRECAIDRDYVHRSNFTPGSRANTVQGYYGLLLDWELLFTLLILEQDSGLRGEYQKYIGAIQTMIQYDRNALFNTMWLVVTGVNRTSAQAEGKTQVVEDVEDCLMRYYNAPQRFPGRNVNLSDPTLRNPTSEKWYQFFEEGIGKTLYPFSKSLYQFEPIANTALTPDLRPQTDFLWSRSPYWHEQLNQPGFYFRMEGPSVDFTVVYWLGRCFGILQPPSDYGATVYPQYWEAA